MKEVSAFLNALESTRVTTRLFSTISYRLVTSQGFPVICWFSSLCCLITHAACKKRVTMSTVMSMRCMDLAVAYLWCDTLLVWLWIILNKGCLFMFFTSMSTSEKYYLQHLADTGSSMVITPISAL